VLKQSIAILALGPPPAISIGVSMHRRNSEAREIHAGYVRELPRAARPFRVQRWFWPCTTAPIPDDERRTDDAPRVYCEPSSMRRRETCGPAGAAVISPASHVEGVGIERFVGADSLVVSSSFSYGNENC
jgi:hypothetical protein